MLTDIAAVLAHLDEMEANCDGCDHTDDLFATVRALKHELDLIAADVESERTDCSTPVFQMVRNLKERAGKAEQEREALAQAILGGDVYHYDGQPGDATLQYRVLSPDGYAAWRVAGPVVSRSADDARRRR